MIRRPYLFDVTRLISLGWTQRRETGIDRVSLAYMRHFGSNAHAVAQHQGKFRILSACQSDEMFDILGNYTTGFRKRFTAFAPRALARGVSRADARGATYLNVSHTDFDLNSHIAWVRACRLHAVYLIHDLIPILHADHCRPRAVHRHHGRVVNALSTAAGIIVNSRTTGIELEAFARQQGLAMPPMLATQLAGAPLMNNAPAHLEDRPYFVCVGTIEPRKNHLLLLKLWQCLEAELGAETPRLKIVGQWGAKSEPVRRMMRETPSLMRHITVHDRCGDAEMTGLIKGSRALLLPSMAEGFGLPMVEALGLGTPVIASDLACFQEFGQDIPMLIDPADESAWLAAVNAFRGDSVGRQRQLARMKNFKHPSWGVHFGEVDGWLAELSERGNAAPMVPLNTRSPMPQMLPSQAVPAFSGEMRKGAWHG